MFEDYPLKGREKEFEAVLELLHDKLSYTNNTTTNTAKQNTKSNRTTSVNNKANRALFVYGACGCGKTTTVLRVLRSVSAKPLPCDLQVRTHKKDEKQEKTDRSSNKKASSNSRKRTRSSANNTTNHNNLTEEEAIEGEEAKDFREGHEMLEKMKRHYPLLYTAPTNTATTKIQGHYVNCADLAPQALADALVDSLALSLSDSRTMTAAAATEASNKKTTSSSSSAQLVQKEKNKSKGGNGITEQLMQVIAALPKTCTSRTHANASVGGGSGTVSAITPTASTPSRKKASSSSSASIVHVIALDEVEYVRPQTRRLIAELASLSFASTSHSHTSGSGSFSSSSSASAAQGGWDFSAHLVFVFISNSRDLHYVPAMLLQELPFASYTPAELQQICERLVRRELEKRGTVLAAEIERQKDTMVHRVMADVSAAAAAAAEAAESATRSSSSSLIASATKKITAATAAAKSAKSPRGSTSSPSAAAEKNSPKTIAAATARFFQQQEEKLREEVSAPAVVAALHFAPTLYTYIAKKAYFDFSGDVRQVAAMGARVVDTAYERQLERQVRQKQQQLVAEAEEAKRLQEEQKQLQLQKRQQQRKRRKTETTPSRAVVVIDSEADDSDEKQQPQTTVVAAVAEKEEAPLLLSTQGLLHELEKVVDDYQGQTHTSTTATTSADNSNRSSTASSTATTAAAAGGKPTTTTTTTTARSSTASVKEAAAAAAATHKEAVAPKKETYLATVSNSAATLQTSADVAGHLQSYISALPEQVNYVLCCLIMLTLKTQQESQRGRMAVSGKSSGGGGAGGGWSQTVAAVGSQSLVLREIHALYARLMSEHHFPSMNLTSVRASLDVLADLGVVTRPQQRGAQEVCTLQGTWALPAMQHALEVRGRALQLERQASGLEAGENLFVTVLQDLGRLAGVAGV